MGNREVLKRGDLQMTSAGTGITHAEYNGSDQKARLITNHSSFLALTVSGGSLSSKSISCKYGQSLTYPD
jgi:hypothetical protein